MDDLPKRDYKNISKHIDAIERKDEDSALRILKEIEEYDLNNTDILILHRAARH